MIHRATPVWIFFLTLVLATFWGPFAHAAPHQQRGRLSKRSGHTLLGWKGLRAGINEKAYQKHPTTSGSGELGDVLYIADVSYILFFRRRLFNIARSAPSDIHRAQT